MIPAIRKCIAAAVVTTAVTFGAAATAEARPAPTGIYCDNIRGHTVNPPPYGICAGPIWVHGPAPWSFLLRWFR